MIPVFRPSVGDREVLSVREVLLSGWLGNGPKTKLFEKRFCLLIGAQFGVALNSASAALHLALLCAGIRSYDEVITPSLTFVATNHPILMLGAKPVFCDVEYDTLCADPADIERKITKKTKAVIVVHYGGHPVDLDRIAKLCREHRVTLIEDCAHASGSYYRGHHVGTFGDFGCFSFAAIKNITTGDGGMLVGKKKRAIEYARALAWSGISKSTWERVKGKKLRWQYDVRSIGFKYQMNDIAAAIGLTQLRKLRENNRKRKRIAQRYFGAFSNLPWIEVPIVKDSVQSSFHNYAIKVPEKTRDKLSEYLAKHGIATTVHYVPSHHYKLYSRFRSRLAVTEGVWKRILLLPIFPDLSQKEQEYIIDKVKKFSP